MPVAAYHVDIREITALASAFGGNAANKIVRDELSTAMLKSTQDAQDAMNRRVKHKSGNYSRSFRREVRISASGIVGIITNAARSDKGFVYAITLENGRGAVHAINAKALRFEIGGRVIFRKSVGPAPAQHIMEFGLRDAGPAIDQRFAVARDHIATRLEAIR